MEEGYSETAMNIVERILHRPYVVISEDSDLREAVATCLRLELGGKVPVLTRGSKEGLCKNVIVAEIDRFSK